MMHNVNVFVYAYKQAPWRIQRQWIGAFLLIVLGTAMVAALYLDVSARAALAGAPRPDIFALGPSVRPNTPGTQPEYTQSLIDWLDQHLHFPPSISMTGSIQ